MLRKILGIILFYGRFFLSFSKIGYGFRSRSWTKTNADFSDQTWLVTGASGGLGLATATLAHKKNAKVIGVARNLDKLTNIPGGSSIQCDLSLRKDIDQLVHRLVRKKQTLDVLVNNVGVLLHDYSTTSEGVETMFATNLLNHYYLTERLIAAEILHKKSTVINVTSGGLYMAPLLVETLNATHPSDHNGTRSYALQKRAQSVLNNYWQKKYRRSGPAFHTMHPGWVDTEGVRTSLPTFRKLTRWVLRSADQGADTILWLAHTRPVDASKLWFDRKARPVHIYKFTRELKNSEQRLIDFLDSFVPES